MEQAVKEDLCGLYNLVNNESISKYDLISLFNKIVRNNKLVVEPNDKLQLDKSLRNTRTDFSFVVQTYEQMVIEMNEWMITHKEFYPHYF
jgi:dTDP-4-dehydrorhamnose reductase